MLFVCGQIRSNILKMEGKVTRKRGLRNPIYFDIIGNLPSEIVQQVSFYLSPKEFTNMWKCCDQWKLLLNIDSYWKNRCESYNYKIFKDFPSSKLFQKYLKKYGYYWKAVYCYNKLYSNFTSDNCRIFDAPLRENDFNNIGQLNDKMVIIRVQERYLRFIDIKTGFMRLFRSTNHETSKVLQYGKWVLVILKRQKDTIKLYHYPTLTFVCEKVFKGMTIDYVKTYKNLIAVLGLNGLFRILDIESNRYSSMYSDVACICIEDDMIIIGKHSGIIQVLDLSYNNLINFNYNQTEVLERVMKSNEYLIGQTKGLRVVIAYVYNLDEEVQLYTIELKAFLWTGEFMNFRETSLHHNNSFTYRKKSADMSTGYLTIDFVTKDNLFEIENSPDNQVVVMKSNENFIFTLMGTFTIKLWCTRTGVPIREISDIHTRSFEITETKLCCLDPNKFLHVRYYDLDIEE